MAQGPTQGAVESQDGQWQASPITAVLIRATAVVIPFVVAWFVVTTLADSFYRPDSFFGVVLWLAQSLVAGLSVSMTTERFTRKILPLASLFNMTLVFPDQAPSRFSVALRSGTLRRLESRVGTTKAAQLHGSASEAAGQAVELVAMLSRHDRMTRGHTERVRAYSDLIAEELGLSTAERGLLAWGALLHDVGKMAVPPEILNKQTRPTDAEWEILAGHPTAAARLLEPLQYWLGEWLLAAPQHHERWDGSGYPLGLAGTEISLAGRIVAVADAYDVITSSRSYKQSMSPEAARKELIRCAGTQFDPDVVRAFLNVSLRRRWLGGPIASLAELPRVINIGANLPAASAVVAGVVVAAGSTVAPWAGGEPEDLAFTTTSIVVESEEVVLTAEQDPAPTTTALAGTEPATTAPADVTEPSSDSTATEDAIPAIDATPSTAAPGPPPAVGQPAPSTTIAANTPTTNTPKTYSPWTNSPPTTSAAPTTTTRATTTTTTTTTTTAPTTTTTTAPTTTTTTAPTTTTTTIPPGSPSAVADTFTLEKKKDGRIFVLNNDDQGNSNLDLDTFEIITDPLHAKDFRIHNDHIHYESEDYTGQDTLEYRICNENGLCDTAILTLTITN